MGSKGSFCMRLSGFLALNGIISPTLADETEARIEILDTVEDYVSFEGFI